MKKLLFVMNNLGGGGAERSLLSLLQTIDYSRYEVDLYLFKHEGLFFDRLPEQVNVLPAPSLYPYFDMSARQAILDCLRSGKVRLALSRVRAGMIFRTEKSPARLEQRVWRHLSKALPALSGGYDAAIGYLEKNPIYFCVEKVKASVKIGWIHIDYEQLGMDSRIDTPYFERLDALITVSEECADTLRRRFPREERKIQVIHNIVSPAAIHAMAGREEKDLYARRNGEIVLLSIGRLHPQKGFELAVEACAKLVGRGYDVSWYIIGEGDERERLTALIRYHGLEERFKLLGQTANPYPYLQQADIYVQPSRFEGKSIAVDEAKILHKPIVVTAFTTVKDQIRHGDNGWIAEMNAESLASGISRVIDDEPLRTRFSDRLAEQQLGTEEEIEKLYRLL